MTPSRDDLPPIRTVDFTIFVCGRSKCEHDYSGYEDIVEDGRVIGGTAACSKCGRTAFDEDQWL